MNTKNKTNNVYLFLLVGLITAIFTPFGFAEYRVSSEMILDFKEKHHQAQASFEDVYYELVKKGHFGNYYNNNLIIDPIIDDHFTENGATLLCLVEWLQQQSDFDSAFLLKRMSKFFCLQFHKLLCKMETPKKYQGSLWDGFSRLHSHEVIFDDQVIKPFRATLTKAIIFIFIISYSELRYDQKKEALVYYLEKIKRELRDINNVLQVNGLDDKVIADFISGVQVYALQEPLVESRNVTKWLLIGSGILVVVGVIAYYVNKIGMQRIKEGVASAKANIKDLVKSLLEDASDVITDRFMDNDNVKAAAKKASDKVDEVIDRAINDIGVLVNGAQEETDSALQAGGDSSSSSTTGKNEAGKPSDLLTTDKEKPKAPDAVTKTSPVVPSAKPKAKPGSARQGLASSLIDQLDEKVGLNDKAAKLQEAVKRVETIEEYKRRAEQGSSFNPLNWPQKLIARALPEVRPGAVIPAQTNPLVAAPTQLTCQIPLPTQTESTQISTQARTDIAPSSSTQSSTVVVTQQSPSSQRENNSQTKITSPFVQHGSNSSASSAPSYESSTGQRVAVTTSSSLSSSRPSPGRENSQQQLSSGSSITEVTVPVQKSSWFRNKLGTAWNKTLDGMEWALRKMASSPTSSEEKS
ncbi:hypothetical protein K2X40_04680 [Candidatus Babeliales bacterium]|nr:hypothetical protein [Candidatus Babeliales bacterium]